MKHSVDKIFKNLKIYLIFILFISFFGVLLTLEHQLSIQKKDTLNNQKNIVLSIMNLKKEDPNLGLMLLNGKIAQLQHNIKKLHHLYKYNITGKYILENKSQYVKDLTTLLTLTSAFSDKALAYIKVLEDEDLKSSLRALKKSFYEVNACIDSIIIQDMKYNESIFIFFEKVIVLTFIIIFFASFWYRKRINSIYADIKFLMATHKNHTESEIFSAEADLIFQKMKSKERTSENSAYIDQPTNIYNMQGLANFYKNRKTIKDSNFTSVTLLEIDNFIDFKRANNQEQTDALIKKIAFTISLYKKITDVVARTGEKQFTIILSRTSKEQGYKDVDFIRQSISELQLKTLEGEHITLSGAYVAKPNHIGLDEAIKTARDILNYTKSVTKNKISRAKDIAEHNLLKNI